MTNLAGRPTPQVVAELAQHYLEDAQAALQRMSQSNDAEALHDARVAMRRLRSLLCAYGADCRQYLPSRLKRRLRRLTRLSNQARDREVQLLWLQRQEQGLRPTQRPGFDWLLVHLDTQLETGLQVDLAHGLTKLQRRLRKPLHWLGETPGEAFATVTTRHALRLSAEILQALQSITDSSAVSAAHLARIKVKRLRYLLMPLRSEFAACDEALLHLGRLQDLLGELHDRQLMTQLLRQSLAQVAADQAVTLFDEVAHEGMAVRASAWQPAQAAGLLALGRRNRLDLQHGFASLHNEYLSQLSALQQGLSHALSQIEASVNGRDGLS